MGPESFISLKLSLCKYDLNGGCCVMDYGVLLQVISVMKLLLHLNMM